MDALRFVERETLERLRGERDFAWRGKGLWARGSLEALARPCVAIVGTRAASAYGVRLARTFAAACVRGGCTVVSGLALGIDAASHAGALEASGPTVGVLGGGHACFFPRRNVDLAQRMLSYGAVLSPFPPECPAQPYQFLERNGVVAALSDAVVVIEAPARSGALNTAGWAAGRIPVFAVPGDVDRPSFAGSHALLRDGATLARDANDVLEALGINRPSLFPAPAPDAPDPLTRGIVNALRRGECDLESLIASSHAAPAAVLATLGTLEIEGRIERREGNRFAFIG